MKRNDRLNEVLRKVRQRRALKRFISLFSVIVLLVTVNTLKMNADTLERIPGCGLAEHAHGAECFDEAGNLICGLAEHAHTDACYQERPKETVAEETVAAAAVEAEVRETDDLELDGCDTEGDAIPEEVIPAVEGDAIQSEAVDTAVEELDGLTLDGSFEDEGISMMSMATSSSCRIRRATNLTSTSSRSSRIQPPNRCEALPTGFAMSTLMSTISSPRTAPRRNISTIPSRSSLRRPMQTS